MRNKAGIRIFIFLAAFVSLSAFVFAGCKKKEEVKEPDTATAAESTDSEYEAQLTEAKAFAGEWTDSESGTILDIWVGEDLVCHGEIMRKTGEDTVSFWSFTGNVMSGEIVYLDCERIDTHYDEAGDVSEESIYTKGRGSIGFEGKNLYWNDAKEYAGSGMVFKYFGEY